MSRVPPALGPDRSADPARVVELAHHHTAHRGACIIGVDVSSDALELYVSEIPPHFEHPADGLLGLVAPPTWSACGLSVPIRAHRLDPAEADSADSADMAVGRPSHGCAEVETGEQLASASHLTLIVQRDGQTTSLFDGPAMAPAILDEPPEGWVLDLLRRMLGLATAEPTESLAAFVEAAWLDAVATEVLAGPDTRSDWSRLARLHPLHPPGPDLPGPLIAVETQALELESDWGRMRRLWASSAAGRDASVHQPDAPSTSHADNGLAHWFDDGSFARWISRTVPPPDELLEVVLALVPADVGAELVDALVSVTPTEPSLE